MRVRPLVLLLAALTIADTSFAQRVMVSSLAPGTSAISGVLIDAHSQLPIAGCQIGITIVTTVAETRIHRNAGMRTGADGRYAFDGIADGSYGFVIQCDGYLPSCYRPPGTEPPRCDNISVATDQRKTGVDLVLIPGATARGQVVDVRGQPIAAASVRLGLPVGDRPDTMTMPSLTDRDGRFVLRNLPAGEWRLEVRVPNEGGSLRPPVVFFPGVLSLADAGSIELTAGKTLEDIVVVAPRMSDNNLTVRVVSVDQTLSRLEVSFVRPEPLTSGRVTIDDYGTGTVKALPPGRYFVTARGSTREQAWAAFDIVHFFGDSQEVLLHMQPASRVTGKVIDDKGVVPSMDGARVGARWIHDGVDVNPLAVDETPVAADGTFRFDGLFGIRQFQLIGFDPAYEIRSILHDRSDVTSAGVSLVADTEAKVVIVVARR
jgi:hypothetical protein